MADSLAKLTERVDALEAENARLKALGTPGAGQGVELTATETPMRDAYEVRSAVTAAVVGRHDSYETAGDEADRLNNEARRDNIRHRGERMSYEVVKVRVVDEAAAREQAIDRLRSDIAAAETDEDRARFIADLERIESEPLDG